MFIIMLLFRKIPCAIRHTRKELKAAKGYSATKKAVAHILQVLESQGWPQTEEAYKVMALMIARYLLVLADASTDATIRNIYSDALFILVAKYPAAMSSTLVEQFDHIAAAETSYGNANTNSLFSYKYGDQIRTLLLRMSPQLLDAVVATAAGNMTSLASTAQKLLLYCAVRPHVLLAAIDAVHAAEEAWVTLTDMMAGWWDKTANPDSMTLPILKKLVGTIGDILESGGDGACMASIPAVLELLVFTSTMSLAPCCFDMPRATRDRLKALEGTMSLGRPLIQLDSLVAAHVCHLTGLT